MPEEKENLWHSLSWQETVKKIGSNAQAGLSMDEVRIRQEKFGLNKLPEEKPLSRIKIFLGQFKSPLIYILILAGAVTLFFKLYTDAIVILAAVVLNTLVGYFQEKKAFQALRELKKLVKIEARVLRDGNIKKIDKTELVPGDIIIFTAGDKIPADGRLIETHDLKINEAPLTGEWLAQEKNAEILPLKTPLADRDNMVYMGCAIEAGKGKAIVTETGPSAEMGKIAVLVKETKEEKTPLQRKLSKFSQKIGLIIAVLCIYIFLIGAINGQPFLEMFTEAIAVAVAAIPEGLPVALTVILALGMTRIVKRKGLVRKLIAAETLGVTSVIATDKTLTLTEGKMKVSEIVTLDSRIILEDERNRELFKKQSQKEQILAVTIAVLCNEAFIENPAEAYPLWRIQGEPTEKAFIMAGAELGLERPEIEKRFPKIDEIPFNPKNKFIATFHKREEEGLREDEREGILFFSGAPEKILELSLNTETRDGPKILDERDKEDLNRKLIQLTEKGARVIAVGYKKIKNNIKEDTIPVKDLLFKEIKDVVFVGFIALKDPLRKEAKEAIEVCRQAGMKPIIVTGDHKLTAKAVAGELGFGVKEENILEGEELDRLSEEEFARRVKDIQIYARVEPRHKLRIISAWQGKGQVVAMTGDGINDTPALKKADIGIALGSGTEAAKEVSDLILLDDNFNIIVAAVEEGRAIIDNIRKVITYLLASSFTETILVGGSVIFGLPLPVTAVQILWVNLIEDSLPAMALAFEKKEGNIMKKRPETKGTPLLTREMKCLIFVIGLITDVLLLGLFLALLRYSGYELPHIRSVVFTGLAIDSLFYIFSCRSLRQNVWQINPFSNRFLILSWALGIIALIVALYLPVFQTLLKTVPLNVFDWQIILGLGLLKLILIEAAKRYFISREPLSQGL